MSRDVSPYSFPPTSGPSLPLGRTDRLIALRQFPAFGDLPPDDAHAIAMRARERRFVTGEVVLDEDRPMEEIAFIVRGRVETRRDGQPLRAYGPRSVIGSVPLLAEVTRGYGCIALEPTIAIMLSADDLIDVFEEHFSVAREALRGLASQTLELRKRMGPTAGFEASTFEPTGEPPPRLDLVGRIAQLRRAMPFAGARLEALADLARDVRELRLEGGDALWNEGDDSSALLFLIDGRVVAENADGLRTSFGPGDVVGGLGTFAREPRWYAARCATAVVALRLDADSMVDVMEDHFDFSLALIRAMALGYLSLLQQTSSD